VKSLLLVAFLVAGLFLVYAGALPLWMWFVLTAVTVFMRLLARLDAPVEELTVTEEGLTRRLASPMRPPTVETVRWDALARVEVRTRETGPRRREPLFLLFGGDGGGVAVAGPLAERHGLVALLRQRLPGFREQALADALATAQRSTFTLWEKGAS
jgi:hypothetical protein